MAINIGKYASGRNKTVTTVTTSPGVTTQASGSSFFVFCMSDSTIRVNTPTDNKSNTYAQIGSFQSIAGEMESSLWYKENGAGGSGHTATVTTGSSSTALEIVLVEVTGGVTSGILDQSSGRVDTATPFTLASSLTTTTDRQMLLAFCTGDSISNPATHTETGLGSYNVLTETDGTNYYCYLVAYALKSVIGAYNCSFTEAGSTNGSVHMVTLKEPVASLAWTKG